jgi:hypothetical protein
MFNDENRIKLTLIELLDQNVNIIYYHHHHLHHYK